MASPGRDLPVARGVFGSSTEHRHRGDRQGDPSHRGITCLEEKDVDVNVSNDILTVRGEKKAEKEEKDKNYYLVERSYQSFSRSIQLPPGTEPDQIQATLSNGLPRW